MSSIKKALTIVNSSFVLILIIHFLNITVSTPMRFKVELLIISLVAPLKILAYAGLYGTLIELVSQQEITIKYSRFRANVISCWKQYFSIVAPPFLCYLFLASNNVITIPVDIFSFFAYIHPPLLFILASILIRKKYVKPLGLTKKRLRATLPVLTTTLGLFFITLFIFRLPYTFQDLGFKFTHMAKLLYAYLTTLTFTYFAALILKEYPEVRQTFDNEKEIYLINPLGGNIAFHLISILFREYSPVFVVIKALSPKTYKFREFNRIFWKKHYYAPGKLVAITCFSSNSIDAYRMAREFKKRGSKVIMGGPHVTYFPDEALEYCDSVVCGELENVWPQVIEDYENNNLQKKYLGTPAENCHELVYQELLHSSPKVISGFLETSRGCKFKCYFCTVPSLSQGKLRKQSISQFIELLKKVKKKSRHVTFIDNNIYSDPAYTKELFLALKPLKMKWSTQCTIDIAKNTELLKLAKESGCVQFLFGFEISEESFEKSRGGKLAMVNRYKEYAKKVKKAGISIKAHYIFGFESDSFKYLYKFWRFCFAINPFATVLSILTPFPGSQFYYNTIKHDRISNLNWTHYGSQTLVFNHPHMNNFILRKTYPLIFLLFLLTTSKMGYVVLVVTILSMIGFI